jgi:hypothetical protein
MTTGEPGPGTTRHVGAASDDDRDRTSNGAPATGWVIETEVSPFHCLYQDALYFHTLSRQIVTRSESEASRLARAALLLYIAGAEALVHQAAVELGRPELSAVVADPTRPLPVIDAWRLLPAILGSGPGAAIDADAAPWPQFAELLALRDSWAYPGPPASRRAYYRAPSKSSPYEPLAPYQIPPNMAVTPDKIQYPRTGLPRDPYALRPNHLDTARGVLDAAIEALDRRLDGALTRDNRHRREPVRLL